MPKPTKSALEKITEPAHIPAIGYAYVDSEFSSDNNSLTYGKKNAQFTDADANKVDDETQFPASSLSKIVFTYLVLQLVKEGHISLDEKLHLILPYKRLMVDGEYPEEATRRKAEALTVRHVLSHTSGLPNVGADSDSTLEFNSGPGEKYAYSGEAILYLQKVVETRMSKILGEKVDIEELATRYVFKPLKMKRSTFLPPSEDDTNVVFVHTELGKPMTIAQSLAHVKDAEPRLTNAAGSLLTTADDFSKFMVAWLESIDDDTFQKAFEPPNGKQIPTYDNGDSPICGLGWHLYRDEDAKLIAYQYGENHNTRSFVAINVTDKKGAAFFTNCEHGMSIAKQIFSSADLAPIGKTEKLFKSMSRHPQSDERGWKETLAGKLAEGQAKNQDDIEKARGYFAKARELSPDDKSKKRRLKWFNKVHPSSPEKRSFEKPLETFEGVYTNPHGDRCEMSIKDGGLVYEQFGHQTKLVRVSETDFLPEKDQSFKISIHGEQMIRKKVTGEVYNLSNQSSRDEEKEKELAISPDGEGKPFKHSPTKVMKTKLKVQAIDHSEKMDNIDFVANIFNSNKMEDSDGNIPPEITIVQEQLAYLKTTALPEKEVVNVILNIQSVLNNSSSTLNQFATEAKKIVLKSNSFKEMRAKMEDNYEFSSEVSHYTDLSAKI